MLFFAPRLQTSNFGIERLVTFDKAQAVGFHSLGVLALEFRFIAFEFEAFLVETAANQRLLHQVKTLRRGLARQAFHALAPIEEGGGATFADPVDLGEARRGDIGGVDQTDFLQVALDGRSDALNLRGFDGLALQITGDKLLLALLQHLAATRPSPLAQRCNLLVGRLHLLRQVCIQALGGFDFADAHAITALLHPASCCWSFFVIAREIRLYCFAHLFLVPLKAVPLPLDVALHLFLALLLLAQL
ncbi:MAG: hypothetical protein IPK16_28915 [Anaerolineales bacterium]|nr:hypothetical protein [Anaerolineales bacterium]